MIDNKPFFDQLVISKQEVSEKLIEMSKSDDYTTGSLFYFSYHSNYDKVIGINLSRQIKTFLSKLILPENQKKMMA